jgi:spore maturation protein CgeB
MVAVGYSPSVRLFEAAACGTVIISDYWIGLDSFFRPGGEILVAADQEECCRILRNLSAEEREAVSERARLRVTAEHTSAHRARELQNYLLAAQLSRRGIIAEPTCRGGRARSVSRALS